MKMVLTLANYNQQRRYSAINHVVWDGQGNILQVKQVMLEQNSLMW